MSVKLWQENESAERQFASETQIQHIVDLKKVLWIKNIYIFKCLRY